MTYKPLQLRPATLADQGAINDIVEAAVMTWNIPDRVKRLALPSYRYDHLDFEQLDMVVAVDVNAQPVGVAAWEAADMADCPNGRNGTLLHGLYVHPTHWRRGIGQQLLEHVLQAATDVGMDGLLVKAQTDAVAFFHASGMQPLPAENPTRHYAHRLWKSVKKPT